MAASSAAAPIDGTARGARVSQPAAKLSRYRYRVLDTVGRVPSPQKKSAVRRPAVARVASAQRPALGDRRSAVAVGGRRPDRGPCPTLRRRRPEKVRARRSAAGVRTGGQSLVLASGTGIGARCPARDNPVRDERCPSRCPVGWAIDAGLATRGAGPLARPGRAERVAAGERPTSAEYGGTARYRAKPAGFRPREGRSGPGEPQTSAGRADRPGSGHQRFT